MQLNNRVHSTGCHFESHNASLAINLTPFLPFDSTSNTCLLYQLELFLYLSTVNPCKKTLTMADRNPGKPLAEEEEVDSYRNIRRRPR